MPARGDEAVFREIENGIPQQGDPVKRIRGNESGAEEKIRCQNTGDHSLQTGHDVVQRMILG